MKKLLLSLSILASTNFIKAQVPNASFENWTNWTTYENPDGWATLNNTTKLNSAYTATKGTPGTAGNSYLKLTSKSIGGGMVPGIAVSGVLDTLTKKPVSGYAFTARPAYFKGKWQYMVYGNTTGSIKVLLSKWNVTAAKRDTIAFVNKVLPGMVMSWANFNLTLTYKDSLQLPDSCMIVLMASDGSPTANDYLWVDDLSFSGSVPVVVVPPTNGVGIKENASGLVNFSLYPNPAGGIVFIDYDVFSKEDLSIEIFDVSWKLVRSFTPNVSPLESGNHIALATSGFPAGIYSVVLKTKTGFATRKLVVN